MTVAVAAQRGFGFVEWFRPGEHERVLRAIEGMRAASFLGLVSYPGRRRLV